MNLQQIVEASGIRLTPTSSGELKGKCPFHDDKNPSLQVNPAKQVWHCFGCAEGGGALAWIQKAKKHGVAFPRQLLEDGEDYEGRWDYVDETGALLFQVIRKPGKRFLQRRPDGKGGWEWKLGDTRRVLYQLPEVLAADPAETVWLAEGEKCVDGLRARGLVAITNPGGAGKWRGTWEGEFTKPLAGRNVIVLPDADEVGMKHARQVAESLKGKAASVRILELPDLTAGSGEDIVDWFRLSKGPDDLKALLADCPPVWEKPLDLRTLKDWLPYISEPDWLWEPWIPRGCVTLLAGPSGIGKSGLALWLIHCLAQKDSRWPDGCSIAVHRPGMLCDCEGDWNLLRKRQGDWGVDPQKVVMGLRNPDDSLDLNNPDRLVELFKRAREDGCILLVVDSLRAATHADENDSRIAELITTLNRHARSANIAVLLIHHKRKASADGEAMDLSSVRGSSALVDMARSVILMDSPAGNGKVRLRVAKSNYSPQRPSLGMTIIDTGLEFDEAPQPHPGYGVIREGGDAQEVLELIASRGPNLPQTTIVEETGLDKNRVAVVLARLKKKGVVIAKREGRRQLWSLPSRGKEGESEGIFSGC